MDVCWQNEDSQCGLASLAMVASAYDLHITLQKIRRRFPLSLKGMKLNRLIQIAQQLSFATRPLRLEMEHLRHCESELNSPINFWGKPKIPRRRGAASTLRSLCNARIDCK
ncbi:TPA: hypothetical protein HH295_07095 [Xanthomonas vasicola pv. zeae]|uniref:Peptidase C39 domain-containing protein n=2 Tax=Xanthomonas vasicola TaxID=56459 RepID=A0ABD7S340_XANVA|nr:cysteine peptidase family C39 domain-containing protein [Xanthomonas vasicola]AVQ07839.1 hypothetical protein C7V42_15710 [Xanthomonas vasicola pv. vasculorum]AZM72037.1 hypothetical protein CXP37_15725 [Xanthomonas vasicola pv. vasculorum]MDO6954836.1 cysteine peptidase family C39 domain-containing protein [Xanthomonas vasicola]MDO6971404.1 cysteine peptidase family C39 domain-containing protein [Xanthomonas vasicola]OWF62744.1 hypothetical protein B1H32_05360 [Xanthomonas vasicola pv. vas